MSKNPVDDNEPFLDEERERAKRLLACFSLQGKHCVRCVIESESLD